MGSVNLEESHQISQNLPKMNGTPSQEEIDAVAHFVEAARELKDSPFFKQEYGSLSLSMREDATRDEIKGNFPDQQIIQGAVVPLRRIWHKGEVCYHARVVNILRRYIPAYRSLLTPILFTDERSMAGSFEWTRDCGLTPTQVIDLWLNTRYHHVGRGRPSLPSRDDFDRFNDSLGPVLFEFYFLQSLFEFGISLFNVLQFTERFLRIAEEKGFSPSFKPVTTRDPRIQRATPGYTPPTDSKYHRVWCLRRRSDYRGISYLLDIANLSDEMVAGLLNNCDSFVQFASEAGLSLEQTDDFEAARETEDFNAIGGAFDNHFLAVRNGRCRRGFVGRRRDSTLVWEEDFVPVVTDQYAAFRAAYLREPFE